MVLKHLDMAKIFARIAISCGGVYLKQASTELKLLKVKCNDWLHSKLSFYVKTISRFPIDD